MPALVTLMDRNDLNGEVFNIGSDHRVSITDLAQQIIAQSGSDSAIKYIPYDEAYGPGYEDMQHRAPCLEKISKAIGYAPTADLASILNSVIEEQRRKSG